MIERDNEDLNKALEMVKKFGYTVNEPKKPESEETKFNRFKALKSRNNDDLETAKEVALNAGYSISKMSKLDQAKQVAKDAGYSVSKMSRLDQAKQVVKDAGISFKKAPVEEPPKKEEPQNTYLSKAAKFFEEE